MRKNSILLIVVLLSFFVNNIFCQEAYKPSRLERKLERKEYKSLYRAASNYKNFDKDYKISNGFKCAAIGFSAIGLAAYIYSVEKDVGVNYNTSRIDTDDIESIKSSQRIAYWAFGAAIACEIISITFKISGDKKLKISTHSISYNF